MNGIYLSRFITTVVLLSFNNCTVNYNNTGDFVDIDSTEKVIVAHKENTSAKDAYLKVYDKALTLWPVPYCGHKIETSNGYAWVIVSGPDGAPPVVLLHGMNSSSTMWYPNIRELARNYRVFAIDNPTEPGKSELIKPIDDMESLMSWYTEVVDKLGIGNFSLIGASKGGWLAVNLAIHMQKRVRKLVLLSPLQTLNPIPPGVRIIASILYGLNPSRERLRGAIEAMSVNPERLDSLYIEQFHIGTQIAHPTNMIMKFKPFGREELKSLKMPVLLLIGDKDIINNGASIKKAKEWIPNAETSVIRNAGHFLSSDQSEIVNSHMLDFLSSGMATSF